MPAEIEFTVKGGTFGNDVDNGHNFQAIKFVIVHCEEIKKITKSIRLALKNENKDLGIKRANDIKKNSLSLFFPCAVLSDSATFDDNEHVTATGLVQFDLDEYSLEDTVTIREVLIDKIPCLYYAFISPKGGLKFAIYTDFTESNKQVIKYKYKLVYNIVREHILQNIELITKLDNTSNQITRGCYLSHDPDIYWNNECQLFEVNKEINDLYNKENEERQKWC